MTCLSERSAERRRIEQSKMTARRERQSMPCNSCDTGVSFGVHTHLTASPSKSLRSLSLEVSRSEECGDGFSDQCQRRARSRHERLTRCASVEYFLRGWERYRQSPKHRHRQRLVPSGRSNLSPILSALSVTGPAS
jgi:hypothetical protein